MLSTNSQTFLRRSGSAQIGYFWIQKIIFKLTHSFTINMELKIQQIVPATVNSNDSSLSGTKFEEGTTVWPWFLK